MYYLRGIVVLSGTFLLEIILFLVGELPEYITNESNSADVFVYLQLALFLVVAVLYIKAENKLTEKLEISHTIFKIATISGFVIAALVDIPIMQAFVSGISRNGLFPGLGLFALWIFHCAAMGLTALISLIHAIYLGIKKYRKV